MHGAVDVCNGTHIVVLEIFIAKDTLEIKFTSKTIKAFKKKYHEH